MWYAHSDGDFQAAAVIGGTVYLGGHFVCVSTISCYDGNTTGDATRVSVVAYPYASSGAAVPDPGWAPWLGPLNSTKSSLRQPYFYGVWNLHASADGSVYVGGVFGNVAVGGKTYKQPKFVKFAPA